MSARHGTMARREVEQGAAGSKQGDAAPLHGWVGAFERVLGDQAEALSQERRQKEQQQQQQGRQAATNRLAANADSSTLLQPQSLLTDDARMSKAERVANSASRASSVHSSASIRPESERGAPHDPDAKGGAQRQRAALASHPGSEAGTDTSSQIAFGDTARKSAVIPLHRPIARRAPCTDHACTGSDAIDELTAQLDVSGSGPSLVTLLGPPFVAIEDLYLNHAPGLQKLSLSNLTPSKVHVRLDSDLGDALSFMRIKEASEVPEMDRVSWPSNSVVWARGDGLSPAKLRDMRQISACLEETSSITIEGSSSITLLVLFRSKRFKQQVEDQQRRLRSSRLMPSPRSEPAASDDGWQARSSSSLAMSSSASSQTSYQSSPTTMITDSRSPPFDGTLSPTPFKGNNGSHTSLDVDALQHVHHRMIAAGNLQLRATREDAPEQDEEVQTISVPFRAVFCKPQLGLVAAAEQPARLGCATMADASGTMTFNFGDLTVGSREVFRLSLQNLSQIECCWQARLEDADNLLSASPLSLQTATGEDVQMINQTREKQFCPYWVRPFSSQEILVVFDAREPCRQFKQTITLTNLHDTSNHFKLAVSASILGVTLERDLDVLSGDTLDFGDCCGGQWTRQIIVLRNQGESMLDLSFSAPPDVEVTFELAKVVAEPFASFDPEHMQSVSTLSGSDSLERQSGVSEYSAASEQAPTSVAEDEVRTPAFESMRTPVSKAAGKADLEPPPLKLEESAMPISGAISACAPRQPKADVEDTDALSNASEAGSQQGSPVQRPADSTPSQTSSSRPADSHSLAMAAIGDQPGKHTSLSQSERSASDAGARRKEDSERGDEAQSVISEVTTTSQESKRSVFASALSQASASMAVVLANARGPHPLSGLRKVDHSPTHRLEELYLPPGAESRVLVSYRPKKGELDEEVSEGKLRAVTFPLFIDTARVRVGGPRSSGPKTRRSLHCKARTCTSFISLSPKLIDFGETNVGTRKTATLSVTNRSELTARVDVRFVSKVLSMYRDEVPIPPLQTVDLRVDFFPRRINDSYRKQITITNLLNRDGDQIFEVRSRNVDQQRVTFHSLFYRILTATGANVIDFGDVNINSTRLRSFSIENISGAPLALELTAAQPEDVSIYAKAVTKEPPSTAVPATRYAQVELSDKIVPMASGAQSAKANGPQLKERFLEAISMDSPTSVRKENASWRLAQKQAQVKKRVREEAPKHQAEAKIKPVSQKKPVVNLVSAMRKGGKGKITLRYGNGVVFKDKTALSVFEHLDLACGPPIDLSRVSAKSKLYQQLEQLAGFGSQSKPASPYVPALASKPDTSGVRSRRDAAGSAKPMTGARSPSRPTRAPALTGQRSVPRKLADFSDVSKLSLDELLAALESQNSILHTFFLGDADAEERQVRTEINLQRRLNQMLSEKQLVPTEVVKLQPGEEKQIFTLYTPNGSTRPHVQGNARKQDSRIFLKLLQFDESLVKQDPELAFMAQMDKEELPVRDLMVKTTTCRSIMELGQPHINFGQMDKGESKTRKIVIQNRSEWVLRYCIRKSGSIASGDIKIATGRYGIIPGYGKREVSFVFSPSMSGQFQEKLVVENVADRDNDQTLVLKANIRKVSNFAVEPAVANLGSYRVGRLSDPCTISISNVSAKTRTFMVDVDRQELRHQRCITDIAIAFADDSDARGALTAAEEEEVEHISQKLKIATRKGQTDKVKKYETRLLELGVSVNMPDASPETASGADPALKGNAQEPGPQLKRSSSAVTFALEAGQTRKLTLHLRMRRTHTALAESHASAAADAGPVEDIAAKVRVYEAKNADDTKTVLIRAQAQLEGCTIDTAGALADMPPNALIFSTLE